MFLIGCLISVFGFIYWYIRLFSRLLVIMSSCYFRPPICPQYTLLNIEDIKISLRPNRSVRAYAIVFFLDCLNLGLDS